MRSAGLKLPELVANVLLALFQPISRLTSRQAGRSTLLNSLFLGVAILIQALRQP
jgi:hypothetical protein